jgi:hypothetical protein
MIQVCDQSGKQLTSGGLPFTASLLDETCLYHIGVHDNGNGTHSAFYVISRPGTYELSLLLNDEHHIYGSPFTVEVLPASTDPPSCEAFGECIQKKIVPDVVSTFTIVAKDAYGNLKQRGGDPFEVSVMGPAKLIGLEDRGDGTYICSLQAMYPRDTPYLTASALSVTVTLHGKHINGSPFRPVIDLSSRKESQSLSSNFRQTDSSPASRPFPTPSNSANAARASVAPPQPSVPTGIQNPSTKPPQPPPEVPGNKLEAARQRALEAAKELPSTPQELVARAMQQSAESNSGKISKGPTNIGPPPSRTGIQYLFFPSHLGRETRSVIGFYFENSSSRSSPSTPASISIKLLFTHSFHSRSSTNRREDGNSYE